jgi:hypothetical protein
MSQATLHAAVPGSIARKLRMVRTWKMWVHALNSLLVALAVLLAAMSVAMLVDYLAMLYDSRWRYVLTNLVLVAAAITCLGWLLVVWRKGLPWARVAGDVDREFPELEERWTTMTRLTPAAVADPNVVHPAMFRRVASEAVRWEPHVDPQEIVSLSPLVKSMLCLTAITLALGIAVVLDARQTLVQLRRFWSPGSSISATQLVDVPGSTVVGRGEPLLLTATAAGRPVERATLFLESPDDERRIALVAHGSGKAEFSHNVRSVDGPFAYRFRAGDGQTEWYEVAVADRPEIAELQLTVTPPKYTRREAKTFSRLPRHVTAIEKSELELALRPTIDVERVELVAGDKPLATLSADADGWYRWKLTLKENIAFAPRLTESHGLTNRQAPRCEITVQADRPPAVKILTPNDQMAVRPDDTIDISFAAQDDVGIGSAELVVYGNEFEDGEPVPLTTIPIPLDDQAGARSVQGKVELDMSQFDVNDGVELSYQIRVREDRGQASATSAASPTERSPSQQAASQSQSQSTPAASSQASSSPQSSSQSDTSQASTAQSSASQASPSESQSAQSAAPASASQPAAAKESPSSSEGAKPAAPPSTPSALETIAKNLESMDRGAPTGSPSADSKPANSKPASNSEPSETARTAESDRRGLVTSTAQDDARAPDESALADDQQKPGNSPSSAASPSGSQPNESQASNSNQNQSQQNSTQSPSGQPSANNTASSSQSSSPSSPSDPPPGDEMARRGLDVPQQSTSQRMRLKVDKWAGSFSGQQRAKAEMAIAPRLAALDDALAKAERTAEGVLDSLQREGQWRPMHDRDVSSGEKSIVRGQELIRELEKESKGTPYAFVGLQVVDIGLAHVDPARDGFWATLESDSAARTDLLGDSRQHLVRARQLLAELRGQYERAKQEFQLAEAVERVKKMYQVYVENSMALLPTSADDPDRYRRKMHEFDLDDEYLKRLEEVMKMREELRAELARILADDPRLLRRLMDSIRNRSQSMREELSRLVADQGVFNREVRAWRESAEVDRPRIAELLLLRQLRKSQSIATSTGELQGRYQAWLPLNRQSKDSNLAAATRTLQDLATAATNLESHAEQFIVETERPKLAPPAEGESAETEPAPIAPTGPTVDSLLADGQRVYELATKAELSLRQLSASDDDLEIATFAANRLADTREIIADSSAWVRQVKAHQANKYSRAAEVEQYRLAMKTEELAGKLGSIEQSLAGALQREDGSLPKPIADKAREFLATLDKEATPNQLASVYALHVDDFAKTTDRQTLALGALEKAERTYDEMIQLAIKEMDKLPVQDPVSNLLDDPTLDQLLAQLEQERPIAEVLGIPPRPTNLRIVDDWLMGAGNLAMAARSRQWMQQQMQRDNRMSQWQLDQAYRRAIARALKEGKSAKKVARPKATKLSDWNRLVSELNEDVGQGRDKAPPEQYRRAIEQYFAQISKAVADAEQSP